jgi:hypothetical protein
MRAQLRVSKGRERTYAFHLASLENHTEPLTFEQSLLDFFTERLGNEPVFDAAVFNFDRMESLTGEYASTGQEPVHCRQLNAAVPELKKQHDWKRDFVFAFSDERMLVLPSSFTERLTLPDSSGDFLRETGFPETGLFDFFIELELGELPLVRDYSRYMTIKCPWAAEFRRLGAAPNGQLCVDERNGTVIIVNPDKTEPDFVNSSLEQLAHFGLVWSRKRTNRRVLAREFKKIDRVAMTEPRGLWADVVDQLRDM